MMTPDVELHTHKHATYTMSLLKLNDDILEALFMYLPVRDVIALSHTCQRVYCLSRMGIISSLYAMLPKSDTTIMQRVKKLDMRLHADKEFQVWFKHTKKKALRNIYTMELRLLLKLTIKTCPDLHDSFYCPSCAPRHVVRCIQCKQLTSRSVVETMLVGLDTVDTCNDCRGLGAVLDRDANVLESLLGLWDSLSISM